jgi:integrase
MRRKRYQRGSLKKRCGKWIGQWWEVGKRKNRALGPVSTMRKSDARAALDKILAGINAASEEGREQMCLGAFAEHVYFPYYVRKWKRSTAGNNKNRIMTHLVAPFRERELRSFKRDELQELLDQKAGAGLSFSVVDHLRWDLRQIFTMAVSEGIISRNPADLLFTPREAKTPVRRVMDMEEVQKCLMVLELRGRLIVKLALLAGMRPGEIFALTWGTLHDDSADVVQRIYRTDIDTPKSKQSVRTAALPELMRSDVQAWRVGAIDSRPQAWVFPSETLKTPITKDNCWRRSIQPKLAAAGLSWVTFQVMRRTHSSLMKGLGVDGKLVADQLGHTLDVNQNVYTQSALSDRRAAVNRLETSLLVH